ncbi:hypothetical protein QQX98_010509 [Neonectria punicea]|uniref:Xylanolytic transcriptional activator regulatory domain-containing protein n=1 Tax=Neonectria punicea TaxID=979145 RepID=A0ABR1GP67_9HYPO
METLPCENCVEVNACCEVPESRRGKHARKSSIRARTGPKADDDNPRPQSYPPGTLTASSPPNSHRSTLSEALHPLEKDGDDGELFLGESATLGCVYDEPKETIKCPSPKENARLRYPVPKVLMSESRLPQWEVERRRKRILYLREDGVFDMPHGSACEMLLKAFLEWFHPCFPILDRAELVDMFKSRTMSPLLAFSIFSVAAAHCNDETLSQAGLGSRQQARYMFFSRAKDLYEVDYEANQTTVTQALFLMSFWRGGRLLDKHTRHWLGIAINLAQSKAMHRCFPNRDANQGKLRRRIWWSIYIRERQCSTALGLPSRIRDDDCDVELLQAGDLEESSTALELGGWILPVQPSEHISYVIEMSKLAQLLGQVIDAEYIPGNVKNTTTRQHLKEKLFEWERHLPEHMSPHVRLGDSLNMQAAMLHLAYNNALILLFRNAYVHKPDGGVDEEGYLAVQAACRNSAVVEHLLSRSLMEHADIHLINSLFNTLCIHVLHLRCCKGTLRSVTEHRAQLCLVALQELQKTWEVTVWLLRLHLFFQALDRATAQRLQLSNNDGFPADKAADVFADILPPSPSTLSGLWGMGSPNAECNRQAQFSVTDPTTTGHLQAPFDWPWAMEGLEDLFCNPSQIDLEQTDPNFID